MDLERYGKSDDEKKSKRKKILLILIILFFVILFFCFFIRLSGCGSDLKKGGSDVEFNANGEERVGNSTEMIQKTGQNRGSQISSPVNGHL